MLTLPGYENLIQIHESANSQVYRARRAVDRQPVILKFIALEYPTPEQIRRYKQEYSLTSELLDSKKFFFNYIVAWTVQSSRKMSVFSDICVEKNIPRLFAGNGAYWLKILVFTS